MLSRLRAALTPQVVLALCAAALLLMLSAGEGGSTLEERASRVLSGMEGAGRVEVVIMTRRMQETGQGLLRAGEEESPVGAVAVAQGADNPVVQMRLCEALCALLGLPASAVSVVTGGQ